MTAFIKAAIYTAIRTYCARCGNTLAEAAADSGQTENEYVASFLTAILDDLRRN